MFQEMELSSSNIKKILIFLEIKTCTFPPQPSKVFFPKQNCYTFPLKNCSEKIYYIFSKESFSYISRNGTLQFLV